MRQDPHSPGSNAEIGSDIASRIGREVHLPLLGRALTQSFRPTHLLMGVAGALVVFGGAWLLDGVWRGLFDAERSPFGILGVFWPTGGPMPLELRLQQAVLSVESQELGAGMVIVLAVLLASLFFGAIARSTASALCVSRPVGLLSSIRFAISRAPALLGGTGIPLVVIGLAWAAVELFGVLLLSAGFTQPIGGVLFVVPLLLGLIVAVFATALAFFHCMLAPATSVDDADGIDAIQRAAGYLVARPIRFVVYVALLAILLNYSYALIQNVCRIAIGVAGGALPQGGLDDADAPFTEGAIAFWVQMLWLVFIGWVISFYGSASTAIYLIMREACDGQDVAIMAARPKASGHSGENRA